MLLVFNIDDVLMRCKCGIVCSLRGEVVGHRGDFSLYQSLVLNDGTLLLSASYTHLAQQQTASVQTDLSFHVAGSTITMIALAFPKFLLFLKWNFVCM